jgi:DNA mismatch endonuclease (patch repair protein)
MPRRTDTVSVATRSEIMRAVPSRGNKTTEQVLVRRFREHAITGWRRHAAIPGRPDFVFPKLKLAIFVDGCFWHGCSAHCRMPKANLNYWRRKIARNRKRDASVNRDLRRAGWQVIRVWEHELVPRNEARLALRIAFALGSASPGAAGDVLVAGLIPAAKRTIRLASRARVFGARRAEQQRGGCAPPKSCL